MMIFYLGDALLAFALIFDMFLFIYMHIKGKKNSNYPTPIKCKKPKFAFLLPARDESAVIGGLLESIANQTVKVDMKDVYVIIESMEDKTVEIAKSYGARVVLRQRLDLKRKGYALDEGVKYILSKGYSYDAYFIFDADNILKRDYLEKMTETFKKGYDIGVGYRNTKNGDVNVVAAASTLTFSMINTIGNETKNKDTRNITISGTGFYIKGSIVEEWKGYPFHTLTEDYELTLYSSLNSLTSYYNRDAEFYDEQPTKFSVSITQRTRWIKGFFESRKKYANLLRKSSRIPSKNSGSQFIDGLGVTPYIIMVVGFMSDIMIKLIGSIYLLSQDDARAYPMFGEMIVLLLAIYTILFLVTGLMIYKEEEKIDLSLKSKIRALLFNPIFLASYIYCAIIALTNDNIGWTKIEHKG